MLVIIRTYLLVLLPMHNIISELGDGVVCRSSTTLPTSPDNFIGPIWPLLETFGDKTLEDKEVIDGFLSPILKEALAKKEENDRAGIKVTPADEDDTLLNSLLSETDDYKLLRDETLNILIAGKTRSVHILNTLTDFMTYSS